MRLITRQEISKEFRIPLSSVISRMTELGVSPFAPSKKGRGYHMLYDADEITLALRNEREALIAKKEKRTPRIRRKIQGNIYEMGWSKAKAFLTAGGIEQ